MYNTHNDTHHLTPFRHLILWTWAIIEKVRWDSNTNDKKQKMKSKKIIQMEICLNFFLFAQFFLYCLLLKGVKFCCASSHTATFLLFLSDSFLLLKFDAYGHGHGNFIPHWSIPFLNLLPNFHFIFYIAYFPISIVCVCVAICEPLPFCGVSHIKSVKRNQSVFDFWG